MPPPQACALAQRFELHFTPAHARWPNMVEIELSVILRGCLNTRFPSFTAFAAALLNFIHLRNHSNASVHWQFTPDRARTALKRRFDSIII